MNHQFKSNSIALAVALAFPAIALAAEPYPALPPTLSTSVTPNIMLYIDTSGSMLQDSNNNWMRLDLCNSNANWSACVNNNTNNYRTTIDNQTSSPNTKMNIAKRVAKNLVRANRNLRFGLFTFRDNSLNIGGNERGQSAVLRSEIKDISGTDTCEANTNCNSLLTAINGVYGRTATPLAEGLLEITRYYSGKKSLYGLNSNNNYNSPIQYRCQRNFTILITDGEATDDQNLPGTGQAGGDGNAVIGALSYTARDSSGGAVAKNFSVCTGSSSTADDGYNITCPSTYDGEATARAFGDNSNRPSAIRDVAMYGNRADLRVGGTDLDGKSFDDAKFSKQSMTTYTVGFSTNNPVLPSTAKVGGGNFYTASNETALASALNQAIDSIVASISNAGGVATQLDNSLINNKVFQPVFNPAGWYGELRCYNLDANGNKGTACSPQPKATIPQPADRKIYSSKVVNTGAPATSAFDFTTSNLSNMTASQKALLGADATAQQNTISFIRGVENIPGFRTRLNKLLNTTILLGDIIDSQPIGISKPVGNTYDADYQSFVTANANRNMILIGANDGMMHAFDVASMGEIAGYIPSAVYPRLKALTASDYGVSTGTPHAYHVNGNMRKEDIKSGTTPSWKTIVAGGLGQGGQGIYAIDATNSATISTKNAVKWEWTDISDSEMGYTFSTPIIYNVRTSASTVVPAVIFANGYENDWDDTASGGQKTSTKSSALYILNAETGDKIAKIQVSGSTGLSSPAGLDVGQDGVLDYVYAGDVNGKMWRFDLTNASNFHVANNPIFDAGAGHPIVMRPAVMPVNKITDGKAVGNIILFGTGQLLTNADRSDTTPQSLYGILDKMEDSPTTVPIGSLVEQTFTDTYSGTTENYRKVSNNAIDLTADGNTKLGWYITLPDSSERLVTSPILSKSKVQFGTGIPISTEKCKPGGKGWKIGVNPLTGGLVRKNNKSTGDGFSFDDITGDNKSTTADKIAFTSGTEYMSARSIDAIPTEISVVWTEQLTALAENSSTTLGYIGGVIALRGANEMAVYAGNQKDGGSITTGRIIQRQESTDEHKTIYCELGTENCKTDKGTGPGGTGYKVKAITWREIK